VGLDGAEVVHLVGLGEEDRDLAGRGARAGQHAGRPDPGVVGAEGDRRHHRGGVPLADRGLAADLPHAGAELVDRQVANPGGRAGPQLQDGRQQRARGRRPR
jgi:hypothetical protein